MKLEDIEENINIRQATRETMVENTKIHPIDPTFIMLCEILDNFLEHKIHSDRVIVRLLKDIKGSLYDLRSEVGQLDITQK